MRTGLSHHLVQELRSDHAGETGAVYIYKGIQAVAQWRGDLELLAFAKAHGVTEADHLAEMENWLPASQRSCLLGPWRLAGWLTGALPALIGRPAVYATIAAVETFVDHHYQQQIDHIHVHGGPEGLLPLLIRCMPMSSITGMNLRPWQAAIPACCCGSGAGRSAGARLRLWFWPDASDLKRTA